MEIRNPTTPVVPNVNDLANRPSVEKQARVAEEGIGKSTKILRNSDALSADNKAEALERRTAVTATRTSGAENLELIRAKLDAIAEELNKSDQSYEKRLRFSVDESLPFKLQVTVTDRESGKVIRQIPSEALVKAADSVESLKGLLYDDQF
jgi:flagellar protein FlaG